LLKTQKQLNNNSELLNSADGVDEGKFDEGGEDEDGADEEPNVQVHNVVHLGQGIAASVVS